VRYRHNTLSPTGTFAVYGAWNPMRLMLGIAAAALLPACAPLIPADIAPEGNGVYLITQSVTSAWLDARSAALKRAEAFCQKQGKHVRLLTPEITTSPAEGSDHAELEFRCE
jgi:hypothetical protein